MNNNSFRSRLLITYLGFLAHEAARRSVFCFAIFFSLL